MVRRQEKEAGWAFIFLGANIDAVQVAGGLGIRAGNAVEFACDDEGGAREFFNAWHNDNGIFQDGRRCAELVKEDQRASCKEEERQELS